MVVDNPDLGHLALFFGLRVNELVMERMKASGFEGVRERYGFVIQHLIERERTITELAERMEVTQQAASKTVTEMIGMGALEMARNPDDRRTRVIRLSNRAWEAVRASRLERSKLERRLIAAVGKDSYVRTQGILRRCLELLGGLDRVESRRVRMPV
jgi:DNA-binding MarR family transcriptional regulator